MADVSLKKLEIIALGIPGWLTKAESHFLYESARHCCGRGAIVEIGSWQGRSTVWLAGGVKAGKNCNRIYAIDPHTGSPEHRRQGQKVSTLEKFSANISRAGVNDVVTPIVETSTRANQGWDRSIELLFIDGAHEYEAVLEDFQKWSPFIIDGGLIVFHDTTAAPRNFLPGWPGPRRVVAEEIFSSDQYRRVGFVGTVTYAQKSFRITSRDRWAKRWVQAAKLGPDLWQSLYWWGTALPISEKRKQAIRHQLKKIIAPAKK